MTGRAWVFGDDISTDAMAPGRYMRGPVEIMAGHCLETVDPAFAQQVEPGDVVVGGRNFGMGSSREQAVQALLILGVQAVVATSFGGIFYRNAINLGMPVLVSPNVDRISPGDHLVVDGEAGRIDNVTTGETVVCEPIPEHLLALVQDGGLIAHLEKKRARLNDRT